LLTAQTRENIVGNPVGNVAASSAQAAVAYRSLLGVTLLTLVTCCCYWFYLAYRWAQEMNRLLVRERYDPTLVLVISICTLGIGGIVYECLFARDLEQLSEAQGLPNRSRNLFTTVLALNVTAGAVCLIPIVGPFIGVPLGMWATLLVQHELNKFAVRVA
jgi:hypothetical protein